MYSGSAQSTLHHSSMYLGHSCKKSKVSETLASDAGQTVCKIHAYYMKHYTMTEINTVLLLFSFPVTYISTFFTKINATKV